MKILLFFVLYFVKTFGESEESLCINQKTPLDDRVDCVSLSGTFLIDNACPENIKNATIFVNNPANRVDKNNIAFDVYENGVKKEAVSIHQPWDLVKNRSKNITLYVPGFMTNAWYETFAAQKKLAAAHPTGTFVTLDPGHYFNSPLNYYRSAAYTEQVGVNIAVALYQIYKEAVDTGTELPYFKIIGHSLGAHTSGQIGAHFKVLSGGTKINEIHALDPARPCFEGKNKVLRSISKDDADQIWVIHTTNTYGCTGKLGHYDYYFKKDGRCKGPFGWGDNDVCYHDIVHDVYVENLAKTEEELNKLFQKNDE